MHVLTTVLWFVLGVGVLVLVIDSALRTFVLPRGATPIVTRVVFIGLRMVFNTIARAARSYDGPIDLDESPIELNESPIELNEHSIDLNESPIE